MMKYRWVALAVVLILTMSSVGAAQTELAEEVSKGFWVEKTHIDLDPVSAGTDAVATFVFHNDTAKEVKIIKAKPS